ncbi:MAG TPA: hypothetical protein VNV37_02675 [Solirubrobacteraceae bacterium]|nr:hypothetical protein [Solirubrobacteraceae bacterium]
MAGERDIDAGAGLCSSTATVLPLDPATTAVLPLNPATTAVLPLNHSTAATALQDQARPAVAARDPSGPLDPYAEILELAKQELQLARDGRIEDLRALGPRWDELTADLPLPAPPHARGPLERAAALHERTSATLMSLREAMLCDMRTAARASRTAHGYARHGVRRVHRVDQSA